MCPASHSPSARVGKTKRFPHPELPLTLGSDVLCLALLATRTLATSFSMLVILVHSVAASSQGCAGMVEGRGSASTRRLPDRLLVAYPGWAACDGDVDHAIRNGVNVIAWSFGALQRGPDGAARIVVQPDLDCIRHVANRHGGTIHLLSFGGWGSPHPDPGPTAAQYYAAWEALNEAPRHRRSDGSPLFDGFDWDLEGNDNPAAPTNTFKVETLQLMGEMSLLAKKAGYLVPAPLPSHPHLPSSSPTAKLPKRFLIGPPAGAQDTRFRAALIASLALPACGR